MSALKKILLVLPSAHNWLSDKDFIWWPFSFLKPEKHVSISFQHTLLMTACFGGLTMLMFTGFAVVNNVFTLDSALMNLCFSFGGFFIWFNLVTKPLWNLRAKDLQAKG